MNIDRKLFCTGFQKLALCLCSGLQGIMILTCHGQNLEKPPLSEMIVPMTFSELGLGPDLRHATGYNSGVNNKTFKATAAGITGRMQSSFVKNYLSPQQNKKLQLADVLAVELSEGALQSDLFSGSLKPWVAYRFEFGLGTVWHISSDTDFGATFTLLRFSRDRVSQNISGSDVKLRYRYKSIMAESGLEVRRDRIAGWLSAILPASSIPLQYMVSVRYLIAGGEQAGLRWELLTGKNNFVITDAERYERIWSLKFFYGVYF